MKKTKRELQAEECQSRMIKMVALMREIEAIGCHLYGCDCPGCWAGGEQESANRRLLTVADICGEYADMIESLGFRAEATESAT